MRAIALVTLILVTQETCKPASGVKWLSIATLSVVDHIRREDECEDLTGLVRRQKQICRKNVELMSAVRQGAAQAIEECQSQFKTRRWNCSTVDKKLSVFGKIITSGTREMAFIHAISSAGVSHAVTKACSTGALERCGCDRTIDQRSSENFEWAGCSDNIAYGSAFSRAFVDARERVKGRDAMRALMNLHNNNAGRRTLEDQVRTQCKCHGVSGSCELKTCWRSLPEFHNIGATLKDRFDNAAEVEERRSGSRRDLAAKNSPNKPHAEDHDLVYLDASPDFCEPDSKTGSLGTHGRTCNKTTARDATDGCELMCCGRGYNTRRTVVTERCHCKFHWCCYVKCQKCRIEVEEYVCR